MIASIEASVAPSYTRGMSESASEAAETCARCEKPTALCVCGGIVPMDHRIAVLILQHPQEQDVTLGTARLTTLHLKQATLKIGLSWPSLSKALGRPADPKRWAVLYLGSARAAELAGSREIIVLDRKGEAAADQDAALAELEGIVLLDGSWSQAKALWWRNPWMLKCRRIVLGPRRPSRYGKLRREPRRDALSTIEAAALLLSRLERRPEIERVMLASLDDLLERYRTARRGPITSR
jgi:DTW domain-containing protein